MTRISEKPRPPVTIPIWRDWIRDSLTVFAILALVIATWRFRTPITNLVFSTDPWLLSLSVVLALAANFLTGLPFQHFLRRLGIHLPKAKACYMQLVAQVTKYIPGNIWGAVLQAQLTGSGRVGSLFLAGTDVTIFFLMTVSVTGIALLAYCQNKLLGVAVALAGWLAASVIASSSWIAHIVFSIISKLSKRPLRQPIPVHPWDVARLFLLAIMHSIVMLGSFFSMLMATTPYHHDELIIGVASICLAWVAGTAAILVPSGLGVREVTFVYIATQFGLAADVKVLAAIAIVSRVVQTLPDVLAGCIVGLTEAKIAFSRPKAGTPH